MLKTSPLNKFYYGLWRAGLIKKLTSRPFASCIQWEAVPMSELALATHFYSHPEILYKVTVYPKSLALRWGKKDKLGKLYYAKWHYNKYVFTIFKQIVTSPIVPMQRKITVFPMQFLKFLWLKRGRILYEFFPGLYKALKKI